MRIGGTNAHKAPDIPELLKEEVEQHLPYGYPILYIADAQRSETCHGYLVRILATDGVGDPHLTELVGETIVDIGMVFKDRLGWRADMLNDLADDIGRRMAG